MRDIHTIAAYFLYKTPHVPQEVTKALLLRTGMASSPLQNTADAKPVRSVDTRPGTVFFFNNSYLYKPS